MPRRLIILLIALIIVCLFELIFYLLTKNFFGSYGAISSIQYYNDLTVHRESPLIWRTMQNLLAYAEKPNRINNITSHCRNSMQGIDLLVDDRGFVCSRKNILSNGCCEIETSESMYYSCSTCSHSSHCCSVYEYCVSCCLQPTKKPLLEVVLQSVTGRQAVVYSAIEDQFDLCLVKCRTNSDSVVHENKYRNSHEKYCYGPSESYTAE